MLLQKEQDNNTITIKSYRNNEINISGKVYSKPILLKSKLLTPKQTEQLSEFSASTQFNELNIELLLKDLPPQTEILLIGTGEKHLFLNPKQTHQANQLGIAIEAMATRQACHTFEVLNYEKRKVCVLLYL